MTELTRFTLTFIIPETVLVSASMLTTNKSVKNRNRAALFAIAHGLNETDQEN